MGIIDSVDAGGEGGEPAKNRQQHVSEHFDSQALYWQSVYEDPSLQGAVYRTRQEAVLRLVDEVELGSGARVLEIGCGAGLLTRELAARGYAVEAIDASPAMVELTARRIEREDGQVRTRVADVHALPFADGSFDLVVAVGVLPWLHEPARALREIARVLDPAGATVLTADNRARLNVLVDPRASLLLAPLKRLRRLRAGATAGATATTGAGASSRLYFPSHVDALLRGCGLQPDVRTSAGFGPFSCWGRPLFSDRAGIAVHERLQALADWGAPVLRRGGWHYLVRARRAS